MIDFSSLSKAINNIGKKKEVKPKIDASVFLSNINNNYKTVDTYFINASVPLWESGEKVYCRNDLESLDIDISLRSMLEKLQ